MKQFIMLITLSIGLLFCAAPSFSQISAVISISAGFAPPELPIYEQPPCPIDGYIWTPGYWAFSDGDYYWVPGVWVDPPEIGFLWTPAYWLFVDGIYRWNRGYWGRHVGFYGGVNYGYGYFGTGFGGGRWEGRHFRYNRAAANIGHNFGRHAYEDRSVVHENNRRTSYNGGAGGINLHADQHEQAAFMEQHHAATPEQRSHQKVARSDNGQFMKVNHGQPAHAAVSNPREYRGMVPRQNGAGGMPPKAQPNNPGRPSGGFNKPEPKFNPQDARRQPMEHPQVSPPPRPQQIQPNRPMPQQHQPAPQQRPQPMPQQHQPMPQQRPQPAPQQHQPMPQQHQQPMPQQRPAPQQQNRPEGKRE